MKVAQVVVQDKEKHDAVLHMIGGPVNIRLFKNNSAYHKLICNIVNYIKFAGGLKFEDYASIQGISGANVGLSLNIVVINTKDDAETFLNPKIVKASEEMVSCNSNCGSLNLPNKIKILRHRWVVVEYYDMEGKWQSNKFRIGDDNAVASATLQHEIEHNLGILVTDKEV